LDPPWRAGPERRDVDTTDLWAASGAQWLTDPAVGVPVRLVRTTLDLVEYLDRRGAALADEYPARGVGILASRADALQIGPAAGLTSCGGATRFVRSRDGWLAVSLAREEDRASVPAWLASPVEDPANPWADVAAAAEHRDAGELVERAALLGIPCSRVGEVAGRRGVLLHPAGSATARPLAGMTVVNLGSLWAAPLAGDLLARLGARVVKVESTTRPDGARATAGFYDLLNRRSQSVALPLAASAGRARLAALLARADVVIEGSRPRALRQMGIDAPALLAAGPRIWVSITSHGRAEPAALRVGFGDDTAAAGGLVGWTSARADREPRFVGDAVADPLTGLTTAATVAHLAATGGRWLVDVALARVAAEAREPAGRPWPAARSDPARPPTLVAASHGNAGCLGRDTAAVLESMGIDT
jgi:hypothetical protein